ncbi:hypothetical protein FYJ51_06555 [Erysipelotrichaceae bacterium Oil+RF-744-GAM-WT-6]|jgi:hypothetical protein|uniref:Uncharacterized protein n=1 Tax=Stecheria intestinalis TaxID=2606630 RepID=A0A7X2TFB8_9FIRM|nr:MULTISPECIES: hypothetical protein [Erysipelotrichaceae]MCI2154220.1 hypothetical protein [Solobacterium sp.]MDY3233908.1 hypothetical protein [Erysipelotrichaceae bacterium]MDY4681904.1 hypothetical protein [Lachnospiraceae bacterium]MDD5881334.1 hypothetical protein [Stecheria intestinalis]MDD6367494.1 hypothetical protein [Stecheria intestinalis]
MDYYDLVFYILDLMILIMEIRMIRVSQKVEIRTNAGPRWLIPVLFWAVAAVGMFNYSGIFRIAQTIALVVLGIVYWFMQSGLSPDGIVIIGRLYPWNKVSKVHIDEAEKNVTFNIGKGPVTVPFKKADMKEVRAYMSRHGGIAKKNVRTK